MRRVISSILIGFSLVLALMVVVGTASADKPDPSDRGIRPPSAVLQAHGDVIVRVLSPEPVEAPKKTYLTGVIVTLPTGMLTGTWWVDVGSSEVISVAVSDQTRIIPPEIEPEVGDVVRILARRVEGVLQAEQVILRKAVRERARPTHIHGEIQQLPAPTGTLTGTWVVNGVSVTVNSETRINPVDLLPEVGMWANVLGLAQDDGSVLAQKIALQLREEAEAETEFEGPIQLLPEDASFLGTWVVDGISVTVTITTQLRGVTPTVGLNAEVEGELLEAGSVLAHRIKVEPMACDRVELEGTVVATGTIPGVWIVETQTPSGTQEISVTVTISTCINESRGRLELGAWVEVKALEHPDGTLEAIHIKVEDGRPAEARAVEFEGTIDALPPSAPQSYRGQWIVLTLPDAIPVSVTVTGSTEIEGQPEIGALAKVEGLLQGNGAVRARSIEIESSGEE